MDHNTTGIREQLEQAAFDGDTREVIRLLDAGADIDAEGRNWNPLHAAIENECFDCVELLVRRGADINPLGAKLSPLAHAVDGAIDGTHQTGGAPGDEPIEIVVLLLEAGADPASALVLATEYQNEKLVTLLRESMPIDSA